MKIQNVLTGFLLLSLSIVFTGCGSIQTQPILPGGGGQAWLDKVNGLAGFQRMNHLGETNDFLVRRYIATDNGKSTNIVTIHYTGLVPLDAFDPAGTIQSTFDLGSSMLDLAHLAPSTNPNFGPIQLPDLFGSSNLISAFKLPQDFVGVSAAQLKAIKEVQKFLGLLQQFQSLQSTNFQIALNQHLRQLLEDQLVTAAIKQTNSLEIHVSLDAILAAYLSAYLNGTFVDRWGTTLSQPDMTKLGNDTVASLTKVTFEAVFDYAMMTPIVHDSSQSSTNKTPTFAVIFPQLYEEVSTDPDAPGITAPENEAINYLSGLSGEGAKHLSALIVKTLGGASVGAKISTGDNSTFSQIISTFNEEFFRRNVEEITYDFFEKFQYRAATNDTWLGYEPNTNANASIPELKALFLLDEPFQDAVVAALVSQDQLKALSQGGWKFSAGNVSSYQALAGRILNTNSPAFQVFSQLQPNIQDILKNPSGSDSGKQQLAADALNNLIQTKVQANGLIYDPTPYLTSANGFSPETQAVLHESPGDSPSQHFQHLNTLLLIDAFNGDLQQGP